MIIYQTGLEKAPRGRSKLLNLSRSYSIRCNFIIFIRTASGQLQEKSSYADPKII